MKPIELLAPGGDLDAIKAAIAAGADAIYCGLDKFNARNRATNIRMDDLNGILHLAHKNNCRVFITLNIIILEREIPELISLLNKLVNTNIDGLIIQDIGLLYLVSNYFKRIKIHASTQLTTHNEGQIMFLSKLSTTRVNLCRELNLNEIKQLTTKAHENEILTEVFVHGSNCISFSGLCYLSSVYGGNSGNRGRCSQPCRDEYITTPNGSQFPLNLKDNSAFLDLKELAHAGVDSLKIEGRIKKFHYVYTVVDAWRKQLNRFYNNEALVGDKNALYKVFNRDFSNDFLKGSITKDLFIDNPRDHSAIHLSQLNGKASEGTLEIAKGEIYHERTEIIASVEDLINELSIEKSPLIISLTGMIGSPLKISMITPTHQFELFSEINLAPVTTQALDYDTVFSRFKTLNDTEYYIEKLDLSSLDPVVFIPFKELTNLKRRLLFLLNDSKEFIDPIELPKLKSKAFKNPSLSIIISTREDLPLCKDINAPIFYQLPNSIKNNVDDYLELFIKNNHLIPYFPALLIGSDYDAAIDFLHRLQPKLIITNNSGIAYEAFKGGIDWIAGPYLNLANSFSLIALKETFNCKGAYLSNELSKTQLKGIKCPEDFLLYYSIYHPIVLMTSRQCFFHTITGCAKNEIDDDCISSCTKSSSITNLKGENLLIEKSNHNYHRIYNESNFLNTDIITDMPNGFDGFSIDLTSIETTTKIGIDKGELIHLFENFIKGDENARRDIEHAIQPFTKEQYKKGI